MDSEIGVIPLILATDLRTVQEIQLMQIGKFLKMLFDFRTLAASFLRGNTSSICGTGTGIFGNSRLWPRRGRED